jgi:hypothetical protein
MRFDGSRVSRRFWSRLLLILVVTPVAFAAGWWRARQRPSWATVERREVTATWHCLFAKDVDVAQLQNGQQVRRLLEAARDGQEEEYPKHLLGCLPHLGQARQALVDARHPAAVRYAAALGALESAVRLYAERLERLAPMEELDEEIVAHARAWYGDAKAKHAGYERFLTCAVPELQTLADDRALYDWLADRCFKHDPVPFMARVRKECGPQLDEESPSPTFAQSRRKFHGVAESPQIQSWESCSDIALEQQRLADARELVAASDAYLAARPTSP